MTGKRLLVTLLATVSMALPVLAQDVPEPQPASSQLIEAVRVNHDGIQFVYDIGLASSVSYMQHRATEGDVQVPSPAYREFTFDGYSDGDYLRHAIQPRIEVYAIEDFGPYPAFIAQLDELSRLLAEQPDLNQYVNATFDTPNALTLPFLPIIPAAQVMRALPEYIDVARIDGIRYLVYYSQAPNPVLEGEMFYTFQGITDDGQYYVSAMLPVNTGVLPTEESTPVEPDDWMADYEDYLTELLGRIPPTDGAGFTPSLATLDALVQSVTVER